MIKTRLRNAIRKLARRWDIHAKRMLEEAKDCELSGRKVPAEKFRLSAKIFELNSKKLWTILEL